MLLRETKRYSTLTGVMFSSLIYWLVLVFKVMFSKVW